MPNSLTFATTSDAPGDSVWLLKELLEYQWSRPVLVTLAAPDGRQRRFVHCWKRMVARPPWAMTGAGSCPCCRKDGVKGKRLQYP